MNFYSSLSFTKKYIFALLLIATLSFLAYLNLTNLINKQANDGEIINISGRQRTLSQKIALFAIYYKTKSLDKTIKLMQSSHEKLLSIDMSERLKKIYFSEPVYLDKNVKKYIQNANKFVEDRDGRSLSYILKNSTDLLKRLDEAVFAYQDEIKYKIYVLQKYEFYLLILVLITLLLEGLFIFRPINGGFVKKTKELIREKEFSDVVTQVNTNAIIAVNQDLDVLTFNKSAEKIFGYTAKEMLYTKNMNKIIPLEYKEAHNAGIENFIKTGKLRKENMVFDLYAQKKDGTIFPIKMSVGVKVEQNSMIIVANIQNVTKEKEKDNLIIEQSRYAAMGEMIGNIAHQWRQPLSSISAIATGAKLRYKNNLISDEELNETFVKIKEHTLHLSKTIDDFRDFFIKNKKKEEFNIVDIVNKSITLIEASYKSNNINLKIKKSQDIFLVNGSGSELSQVFLNILNNAKDVLVEKNILNKIVLFEILKDNDAVIVNISDNAGGIASDISQKVFEPYFTTKHKSQGTGIGLFMSKRIIEQHFEGSINTTNNEFEIDGEKYFGAQFCIQLKLV